MDATDSEPAPTATLSPGKLLKRSEAARLLGVSTATVRRMEGSTLSPIRGPDGVHRFHEEHVRELVIHRVETAPRSPEEYDAEEAATAFELFDQDVDPVDVVKRTKLDPRAVMVMHRLWVSMRGGYVVSGEVARQIGALPYLFGPRPIWTGEGLFACLEQSFPLACPECKSGLPAVCADCAKRLSAAAASHRIAQARARQDDRIADIGGGRWDSWEFPAMRDRQREKT